MGGAIENFLSDPSGSEQVTECFTQLLDSSTDQSSIARFLTYLHETGLDRKPEVIKQAVEVLRGAALKWELGPTTRLETQGEALATLADRHDVCVDIVGTGGDGHNTFNVSTTAAIVAAGVPGIRVIKHGNKASTSSSGSADILKSYGCNLTLQPTDIPSLTSPFLFLLAPIWNPALGNVAAVRKSLPHPTIFNILGPLLNPAPIDSRVIGVHSPALGPIYIDAFSLLNPTGKCMVVCGDERLDEISPAGRSSIWTYDAIHGTASGSLHPSDFGLRCHTLASVRGGTPNENVRILVDLIDGKLSVGDAILDYVLINCTALLTMSGVARDYKHGVEMSLDSISSGRAKMALEKFRSESTTIKTTTGLSS